MTNSLDTATVINDADVLYTIISNIPSPSNFKTQLLSCWNSDNAVELAGKLDIINGLLSEVQSLTLNFKGKIEAYANSIACADSSVINSNDGGASGNRVDMLK